MVWLYASVSMLIIIIIINSVAVKCPDWYDSPTSTPLCSINPQNLWIYYFNWPLHNHILPFSHLVLRSSPSSSSFLCCAGFPLENKTQWLSHTNERQAGRCLLLAIKEGDIVTGAGPVYTRQHFQSWSWWSSHLWPPPSPPPAAYLCCHFATARSSISIDSRINVRQEHNSAAN